MSITHRKATLRLSEMKRQPIVRTLFPYVGGKSKALKHIIDYLPQEGRVISPFLGSGKIEFVLAKRGVDVYGYDAFPELVNFWLCVKEDAEKVSDLAVGLGFPNKEKFLQIKRDLGDFKQRLL
jgi:site-specific DNA-adenine methylase